MDEGAFVLDYQMPPGTALSETDRVLKHVEQLLLQTPEVESYSRRTGTRLALAVAEPHRGDFLIKLRPDRKRDVEEVKKELRERIHSAEPALEVDMPGILGDLIGDLTWSPKPIEIKVFSTDVPTLKQRAAQIDRPLKTYSSGMVARLAFASAIFQHPDILLLDEVLATGDGAFVQKSYDAIKSKIDRAAITVIVSHDTQQVIRMCNRFVLMHQGRIINEGSAQDIRRQYERDILKLPLPASAPEDPIPPPPHDPAVLCATG
jgi:Cu/Ag efflux pump CusA